MLSRFVPLQFANYGLTFWIPCQVEPSIALIGLSLPALRQLYFKLRGREPPATIGSSAQQYSAGSNKSNQRTLSESNARFYAIRSESEIELQGRVYS